MRCERRRAGAADELASLIAIEGRAFVLERTTRMCPVFWKTPDGVCDDRTVARVTMVDGVLWIRREDRRVEMAGDDDDRQERKAERSHVMLPAIRCAVRPAGCRFPGSFHEGYSSPKICVTLPSFIRIK